MDNLISFPDRKGDISYERQQKSILKTIEALENIRYQRIMALKDKNPKEYLKQLNEFYDKKEGVKKEETIWDDRMPTLVATPDGKLTAVRPKMGSLDIKIIPIPRLR